jgi:hypothetical protein
MKATISKDPRDERFTSYSKEALDFIKEVRDNTGYWSGSQTLTKEGLAHGKKLGVMFDNKNVTHAAAMKEAKSFTKDIKKQDVANAFVSALSGENYLYRSALGSYARIIHMPEHRYLDTVSDGRCEICGGDPKRKIDFELNYGRIFGVGVLFDDIYFNWLDLKEFRKLKKVKPTKQEVDLFKKMISCIASISPQATINDLEKKISKLIKSNKYERMTILECLGLCGVIKPSNLKFGEFLDYYEGYSRVSSRSDWLFPAGAWRGKDGIDERALKFFFGHLL